MGDGESEREYLEPDRRRALQESLRDWERIAGEYDWEGERVFARYARRMAGEVRIEMMVLEEESR
jgi:hypothetical protein